MATQFYITSYIAQQGTAYGSMRADGTYAGSTKGHMWVDFSGESKSYGYGDGGVIYTDSKDYKNIDGYPNIIAIRHEGGSSRKGKYCTLRIKSVRLGS